VNAASAEQSCEDSRVIVSLARAEHRNVLNAIAVYEPRCDAGLVRALAERIIKLKVRERRFEFSSGSKYRGLQYAVKMQREMLFLHEGECRRYVNEKLRIVRNEFRPRIPSPFDDSHSIMDYQSRSAPYR